MQHADQTVTYYVLDKDGHTETRTVLRGVSWTEKTVSTATEKGALLSRVVVCRIPSETAPAGFLAQENAMLVRGECPADDASDAALKHSYGAVAVKTVTDNRNVLAPHWKLEAV